MKRWFDKGYDIYGMEINKTLLEQVPEEIKDIVKWGDITKGIPFNQKFDVMLMYDVLEHIKEDELALENVSSGLKKGGHLILTTPRSVPFFQLYDPAWIKWKSGFGEMHHHYTIEELFRKFNDSGLRIEKITSFGNFRWLFFRWYNILLKYIFKSKKLITLKNTPGYFNWRIKAVKI